MDDKEYYYILRRRKRISQGQIAKYLCCSQSLISRYELGDCSMSQEKIEKYKKYIENYTK